MQILLYLILVFSFNLIQTIGAFAGTMLAMPFAILLFGAEQARLVLAAVGILSCIYPILSCYNQIAWREVAKIGVFMLAGILAAQGLLHYLYGNVVLLLYGLLVILVALRNFVKVKPAALPKGVDYLILLAAGLVHGAFLSGGSFLVIYAMRHFREKGVQRATLSVLWLILNGSMLAMFAVQGQYNMENLHLVWIALIPAIAGILLGDYLQSRLNGEKFRIFTNCMLLLSGGVLLFNCLFNNNL